MLVELVEILTPELININSFAYTYTLTFAIFH